MALLSELLQIAEPFILLASLVAVGWVVIGVAIGLTGPR